LSSKKPWPGSILCVTACFMLIRSEVFKKIGMFDERFFVYAEDFEFCHRANTGDIRFDLVSDALVFHKSSGPSGSKTPWFEKMQVITSLLLCETTVLKYRSHIQAAKLSTLFFLMLRAAWRTIKFGNANSIIGLKMAFQELRA
jgi:GT2 family glycosyltransferase